MAANSVTKVKKKFIESKLDELNIEECAKNSNFYKGNIKKITLTNLLLSFFLMSLSGKNTYSKWAEFLGGIIYKTVSKVAIWKRMNQRQVDSLRRILENTFNIRLHKKYLNSYKEQTIFSPFGEVYIQDSTIISLPDELSEYFKGSVSKGKQKSSMRIQVIYGLKKGQFKEFELGSFTDNDQGAAGDILSLIKSGDLVIRDLGYFKLKVFVKIASIGAYFLSRYRYGTTIYDATGKKIELLDVLKNKKIVDINVLVGAKEKLPCRLVAVKVPDNIAGERRRKAAKDRDKRLNHSTEYMKLLEWAIYITNVERETWSYKEIIKAYRLRWTIEIIFKSWKSHFNMSKLVPEPPKQNKNSQEYIDLYKQRVESVIYMLLIFIMLFQLHIYMYFVYRIIKKHQKFISLLKLCSYISNHKEKIFNCTNIDELEDDLAYYTVYEKRKKRRNSMELHLLLDAEYEYKIAS